MVLGLFCNSIFGVLMTTFLVIKVLSSVLRPARSIFRKEFLGSKSQSFLLIYFKNVRFMARKGFQFPEFKIKVNKRKFLVFIQRWQNCIGRLCTGNRGARICSLFAKSISGLTRRPNIGRCEGWVEGGGASGRKKEEREWQTGGRMWISQKFQYSWRFAVCFTG